MSAFRIAITALCLSSASLTAVQSAPQPKSTMAVGAVIKDAGFQGFAMVADARSILWQTPRASCPAPTSSEIILCHPGDPAFMRWPWASVTKQVLAVLAMGEVDRKRIELDAPASRYLPVLGEGVASPTIRQLLQHRAGLRNPNISPADADGTPDFYTTGPTGLAWCLTGRSAPGGDWQYNNCDSIVLGAVLAKVTGQSVADLFDARIAGPLKFEGSGFVEAIAPTSPQQARFAVPLTTTDRTTLARYGAAGGLAGTALDLLALDRALLRGDLLSPAARDEMWRGDPSLGYMALSQWAFEAPLKGCAKPVRLIERRGEIGRFQVRNIIMPDLGLIVIVFTDKPVAFGEIWQGKGFSHDLLAAAACA